MAIYEVWIETDKDIIYDTYRTDDRAELANNLQESEKNVQSIGFMDENGHWFTYSELNGKFQLTFCSL